MKYTCFIAIGRIPQDKVIQTFFKSLASSSAGPTPLLLVRPPIAEQITIAGASPTAGTLECAEKAKAATKAKQKEADAEQNTKARATAKAAVQKTTEEKAY